MVHCRPQELSISIRFPSKLHAAGDSSNSEEWLISTVWLWRFETSSSAGTSDHWTSGTYSAFSTFLGFFWVKGSAWAPQCCSQQAAWLLSTWKSLSESMALTLLLPAQSHEFKCLFLRHLSGAAHPMGFGTPTIKKTAFWPLSNWSRPQHPAFAEMVVLLSFPQLRRPNTVSLPRFLTCLQFCKNSHYPQLSVIATRN